MASSTLTEASVLTRNALIGISAAGATPTMAAVWMTARGCADPNTSTTCPHSPKSASTRDSEGYFCARASAAAEERRSRPVTVSPRASNASTMAEPSQPEAPVTRMPCAMGASPSLIRRRCGNHQEHQGVRSRAVQFVHDPRGNESHVVASDDPAFSVGDQYAFAAQEVVDLLLDLMDVAFHEGTRFIAGNAVVEEPASAELRRHDGLGKRLVMVSRVLRPEQLGEVASDGRLFAGRLACG